MNKWESKNHQPSPSNKAALAKNSESVSADKKANKKQKKNIFLENVVLADEFVLDEYDSFDDYLEMVFNSSVVY